MTDRVTQAETRAEAARQRLAGTALTLRNRLKPASLLEDGVQALGDRAVKTTALVKRKPLVAVTAATIVGVAFALGRKRLTAASGKTARKLTLGQVVNGIAFVARLAAMLRKESGR